jgi:AraC-like DNA-binding protein
MSEESCMTEPKPVLRASQDSRISRIIGYINRDQNLTRRELAQMVNLSVWHVVRLFKRDTGIQLNRYLQERRLQCSARLLATSEHPVKTIAFMCGYQHSSSFVRAFIHRFGESPECYRRRTTSLPNEPEVRLNLSA